MVYYKSKKEHRKIYSLLPKKEKKVEFRIQDVVKQSRLFGCVFVWRGGGWGVTMYMAHQFTVL